MPRPEQFRFTVSFPTEDGFLGRECNAPDCKRFFKVHKDHLLPRMYCPYCGLSFPKEQLWTSDQAEHIRAVVAHEVVPQIADELRATMRRVFKAPHWKFQSGGPTTRPAMPTPPAERSVDSELLCPVCAVRFQVDGIFGFCPGCSSENLRMYDANLEIIRHEVSSGTNPARALRHGYADLVSTFEIFCRKEAKARSMPRRNFQNLPETRDAFLARAGVDILAGLSASDDLALRRAFQKRHVWEHNEGRIDERYLAVVPEDRELLGQAASLSLEELYEAAHAVRRVLKVVIGAR